MVLVLDLHDHLPVVDYEEVGWATVQNHLVRSILTNALARLSFEQYGLLIPVNSLQLPIAGIDFTPHYPRVAQRVSLIRVSAHVLLYVVVGNLESQ